MFSGYGQTNATVWDVLMAVEKFMEKHEHRDRALDHLEDCDTGGTYFVRALLSMKFMFMAMHIADF
mgnify:CR=1 FL=1